MVRIPGGAAITAGMALTTRPAAPAIAAWLWSPLRLLGMMSTAYDGSPVISTRYEPSPAAGPSPYEREIEEELKKFTPED